jgi:hypothetical protein
MELESSLQATTEQLQKQTFDAFIAVSGYESRGTFLANQINVASIPNKYVLAFTEKNDLLYRELNNQKFKAENFTFFQASSSDTSGFRKLIDEICDSIKKSSIDILIDYSSMPKIWYSEIINYFISKEEDLNSVNIWFTYSPSEFTRSISSISNKYNDPVKPILQGQKPIALIMGLGYEKGRAEEFTKMFNAKITYAFYANPSVDARYVQEVLDNNKTVLQNIKQEQIIPYPIYDLNTVNDSLTELCIDLRINHQVVLVPVGPKPFTLMCFILSARYPDIKICRVSSIINSGVSDRRAVGDLVIYKVTFTNEESDY